MERAGKLRRSIYLTRLAENEPVFAFVQIGRNVL